MLLISRRRWVIQACESVAESPIARTDRWIPNMVACCDVLVADGPSLTRSERKLLQAFSRLRDRQPIILIDGDALDRSELALLHVEWSVQDGDAAQLVHAIQGVDAAVVLRRYGRALAAQFAHAAAVERATRILFAPVPAATRVKSLAAAAGVSERTLRAQWQRVTRGAVRLSDVVRLVKRASCSAGIETTAALHELAAACALLGCRLPDAEDGVFD